ncbi:hypothetical protein [Rhodanobacter lindaniclasticus]
MTTPLPPNDPPAADEKLPGEAELAALYRQLPKREPGPALDAAVLRAAAQAIDARDVPLHAERRRSARESGDWVHPEPLSAIAARAIPSVESAARTRRRHVPHWLVALGSAASLELVAGLARHMRTTPTAGLPEETAASAQAPVAAAPVAKPYAERTAVQSAAAPSEPVAMATKRRAVAADHRQSVAPVAAEMAPPPPTPKQVAAPREAAPAAKAQAMQQRAAEASAPAPPPMQPARREVPAMAAAPAPAPPAPPADTVQDGTQAARADLATPAEQLAHIEQLFAQGDTREAQQRLLDFHRAHPQWPLPPELQARLPKP